MDGGSVASGFTRCRRRGRPDGCEHRRFRRRLHARRRCDEGRGRGHGRNRRRRGLGRGRRRRRTRRRGRYWLWYRGIQRAPAAARCHHGRRRRRAALRRARRDAARCTALRRGAGAAAAGRGPRLNKRMNRRDEPRAVGTPFPELTDSRMRASSSSADCARPKARSSAATTSLSICMKGSRVVRQVAHGHEAGHARATLERVQGTLQRVEAVDAGAVLVPLRERVLRSVDELDGLVGEDAGDVLVEIREDVFGDVGGRCAARVRVYSVPAERKRGAPRPPARQC